MPVAEEVDESQGWSFADEPAKAASGWSFADEPVKPKFTGAETGTPGIAKPPLPKGIAPIGTSNPTLAAIAESMSPEKYAELVKAEGETPDFGLGPTITGGVKAAYGVRELANVHAPAPGEKSVGRQVAGAAGTIAGGLLDAATPAMGAGAIADIEAIPGALKLAKAAPNLLMAAGQLTTPLRTAIAVGVGSLTQEGIEKLSKALDIPEEYGKAAGILGGLVGGTFGASLPGMMKGAGFRTALKDYLQDILNRKYKAKQTAEDMTAQAAQPTVTDAGEVGPVRGGPPATTPPSGNIVEGEFEDIPGAAPPKGWSFADEKPAPTSAPTSTELAVGNRFQKGDATYSVTSNEKGKIRFEKEDAAGTITKGILPEKVFRNMMAGAAPVQSGAAAPPQVSVPPSQKEVVQPNPVAAAPGTAGAAEEVPNATVNGPNQGLQQPGEVRPSDGVPAGAPAVTPQPAEPVRGLPVEGAGPSGAGEPQPVAGDQGGNHPAGVEKGPEVEDVVTGRTDIGLTPEGVKGVEKEAPKVANVDAVYTTPMTRGKDTAAIVAPDGVPVKPLAAFGPWDLGKFQGHRQGDVEDKLLDYMLNKPDVPVPGGASYNAYKDPLIGAVQKQIADWKPGDRVLNVTHSIGIHTVNAWVDAGLPEDKGISAEFMRNRPKMDAAALWELNPRTKEMSPVQDTKGDGIFFLRHGETSWDNVPQNGERAAAPLQSGALTKESAGATRIAPDGTKQVLRRVPIENIEGDEGNTIYEPTVEKYQKEGYAEQPVLRAKEGEPGNYVIHEGHHRILADVRNGAKDVAAWVPEEPTTQNTPSNEGEKQVLAAPAKTTTPKEAPLGSRVPPLPEGQREGLYVRNAPTVYHASKMALQSLEVGRYSNIANAYTVNLSGMELIGRAAGLAADSVGPTHVGLHISAHDAARTAKNLGMILRHYYAGEGFPDAARHLLDAFKRAAKEDKSIVFISDHPEWEQYHDSALTEELDHALQATMSAKTIQHFGQSIEQFVDNPTYKKAAEALTSRYPGMVPDSPQGALEVGVRLMRPDGYGELGLTQAEARALAAHYIRTLRKEYGSQSPRQIAQRIFESFSGQEESGGLPYESTDRGRGAPSGGTGSDLSPYKPSEPLDQNAQRDQLARDGGEEANPEQESLGLTKEKKGERGAAPLDFLSMGASKFIEKDVVPTVKSAVAHVAAARNDILRVIAPASRGPIAKEAALTVREKAAELARSTDRAAEALDAAHKMFETETKDSNLEFIDRIENRLKQPDGRLQMTADLMREMLDDRRKQVQELGTGKLENFYEDYFPHIWKQPDDAERMMKQWFAKRPMEGSKSFLKQRKIPTIKDGIELGLEPESTNPVDLVLSKIREMDKYLFAHHAMDDLKETGVLKFVRAGHLPPDDFKKIEDKIATVYGPRTEEGAQTIRGAYYAPEPAATVINNYLSPGLRKYASFRAYMGLGNMLNQFQLGWSAYHLGFTSFDAAVSRVALGIMQVAGGKPVKGLSTALSAPLAPLRGIMEGDKILKEWYRPGTQGNEIGTIVDAMMMAGGRARMDKFYQTQVTKSMMEALRQGNVWGAALRSPFALTEQAARPIMEYVVPRQKMAVFADLARLELEKAENHGDPAKLREALAKAWDSVDNRMGQIVYDNLFWNKTVKDLAMASTRSVGWNLGTIREIIGGTADTVEALGNKIKGKPAEFTPRMAYILALPIVAGIVGGLLHYMTTGQRPEETKDYFFPRRGPKGTPGWSKRMVLPSYVKDVVHWTHDPYDTARGKIHPLLSLIMEMLSNKDYFDKPIRHSGDPIVKQMEEEAAHVGKTIEPIAARTLTGPDKKGQETMAEKVLPFIGITEAPKYIKDSEPAKPHHRRAQ